MQDQTRPHEPMNDTLPRRPILPSRDRPGTAALRAIAWAACSELLASPHELDVRESLREHARRGLALPWSEPLEDAIEALRREPRERLQREYSGLFEVGDAGPPVPMRESLRPDRPPGALEEVARFYEHFGYALDERWAWQPDHLSLELEFVHFLCFHEAHAPDDAGATPYQLAQLDFTSRHVALWLPRLASDVASLRPESPYGPILAAVRDFVAADLAWQTTTIADDG